MASDIQACPHWTGPKGTLIAWGKNDVMFPPAGAVEYKRDLKTFEFHLLDTGHFALEEDGDQIAGLMRQFLRKHIVPK